MKRYRAGLVLLVVAVILHPVRLAAGAEEKPAFPVRVAASGTHFEDNAGRPYLIHGDTAWSLIAQLLREDVELYLADRSSRGFNALLVNLIEHQFADRPPANAYGDLPFDPGKPFATMGRAYFDHAAWVLERAEQFGFLILLAPAYLGAGGGGQGWYFEVAQAGDATLERYGEAIARRFAERRNIVWVHGGDYNPPDTSTVRAMVRGIRRASPDALHTVHGTREVATADYWSAERWLSFDTAYTYDETHAFVVAQPKEHPRRPLLMIEGLYEGEHGADEEMVRRQAYGALLAGAAGHFFGNNPVWHFDGRGLFPSKGDWRAALASRGAQSISHLRDIFLDLPWWLLSPVERVAGLEIEGDAYLASTSDGSMAIGYLPDISRAQVAATAGTGELRWIDPSSGRRYDPVRPVAEAKSLLAPPAELNASSRRDWFFILRAGE